MKKQSQKTPLHTQRLAYKIMVPTILRGSLQSLQVSFGKKTTSLGNAKKLTKIFTHTFGQPIVCVKKVSAATGKNKNIGKKQTIGVILSGGPAAGGHNVICGLFDALKKAHTSSSLIGFLSGAAGLINNKKIVINKNLLKEYRNTGGFDIIGSGRTKIESVQQFASVLKTAKNNKLDAIVIIGGDDSNTNAALLAEYFMAQKCNTQVIGIPKTIDGDLKSKHIETSFGFDTAVKTYAELIGNIARDSASSGKYWHFIRLMGRSASHITLECALQTQPNITLISEEVEKKKQSLADIVKNIADVIVYRGNKGIHYGVILIPEGLIEFIPEIKTLIERLNDILAQDSSTQIEKKIAKVQNNLSATLKKTFNALPQGIKEQLLLDRDAHGNVQVSLIETEKLLIEMVGIELAKRTKKKLYKGTFATQKHFFGYEARCAFPSNFDTNYCYALGYNAFVLIRHGLTGYMSAIRGLTQSPSNWQAEGVPLTMLMDIERRHGQDKPVIRKALVKLNDTPFLTLVSNRKTWARETCFRFPGAIQYFGGPSIADVSTITLVLEKTGIRKNWY